MHYLIYPTKDTWIHSKHTTYNYGLDEILEIRKSPSSSLSVDNSRILIQFDLSNYSSAALASASYFYLNLYAANAVNLPSDYTIEVYAMSQSWANGTGFPASTIIKKDGASWKNRTESILWSSSGGDYLISSGSSSQVFNQSTTDIRLNVTNIVRAWVSGTMTNNGFMIKRPVYEEVTAADYGRLTYYSRDSHTVNLPTLEAVWDDSIHITGSSHIIYSGVFDGYISDGIIYGSFVTSSGILEKQEKRLSGNITASFVGSSAHHTVTNMPLYVSQSYASSITIIGRISGSYVGTFTGSLSGSMSSSMNASKFTGQMTDGGPLNGTYINTAVIGTLEGTLTSSAISRMYLSGTVDLIVSGTSDAFFAGITENAKAYQFISEIISGSSTVSSSITGSYISASGLSNFSNASISNFTATVTNNINVQGRVVNTVSGSTFLPLESDSISIVLTDLKKEYKYATSARIRLRGKDLYQRKTFVNTTAESFNVINYLPMMQSRYSIVDAYTGRVIIPFSNYTFVSCDLNGNYIDLNLNGFMPERFYRIIFKITYNGVDSYFDNNYIFKVVK